MGSVGTNQGFQTTNLDDSGTPIANGGAPFTPGKFAPQQSPLGALDGKLAAGTYKLEIINSSTTAPATLTSWSLALQHTVSDTGLGEAVADQVSASFRIFTMAATNPLASSTWTAVGPASIGGGNSGRIGGLAVDPSDPSGNTVFVGGASGGVWKTTDFLNPAGPTYIPVTAFGPAYAYNIGSIAVFPRNNNPNQSIIFAATGEGDTGSAGVGVLRSMDGGVSWTLLDSTENSAVLSFTINNGGSGYTSAPTVTFSGGGASIQATAMAVITNGVLTGITLLTAGSGYSSPPTVTISGGGAKTQASATAALSNAISPVGSPLRDHAFVGDYAYKILVDPNPTPNGNVVVYMALSGPTGGIWVSTDSGNTWGVLNSATDTRAANLPGQATDVEFDNNSGTINKISNPTGNIQVIYGAIQGVGVFLSPNGGQVWNSMTGGVGDPLIQDGDKHMPAAIDPGEQRHDQPQRRLRPHRAGRPVPGRRQHGHRHQREYRHAREPDLLRLALRGGGESRRHS